MGDKTFYAAWACVEFWYFAQYDANGRMLAVTQLPNGEADLEAVEPLEEAVTGKLFRLDDTGAPLQETRGIPLTPANQNA